MTTEDKREQNYHKLYHRLKQIATPVCHLFFGIQKDNEIRLPEEPCLIVVNHTCYFDPLIMALCVDRPICFVTAENLLRHRLASFLAVNVFRSIPCSKGKMSVKTVSEISKSLKAGRYVTMFAEGNITYDGATAPLAPVNGKLFRSLKCTVVTIATTGAYQILPRWSRRFCRGKVRAERKGVYTKEMLHDMTPEEILKRINQDLYVEQPSIEKAQPQTSVDTKQPSADMERMPIDGKQPSTDAKLSDTNSRKTCRRGAKGIHHVLYTCPECHALGTIRGKGKKIHCLSCGQKYDYNKFGTIDGCRFETIWQWNRWQESYIHKLVQDGTDIQIPASQAKLYRIAGNHKRKLQESGILRLGRDLLSIGSLEFPLADVSRMDTRNKGVILFSINNKDYYEVTLEKGGSGLMYKTIFEAIKGIPES